MPERNPGLRESDTIEPAHFPEKLTQVKSISRDLDDYQVPPEAMEERHMTKAPQRVGGDKVKTAQILGHPLSQAGPGRNPGETLRISSLADRRLPPWTICLNPPGSLATTYPSPIGRLWSGGHCRPERHSL